jgi:hypothetical protein
MDNDLLNNCHPAMIDVAFIYDTDIGLDVADFDDENDGAENDTITNLIGGQTSWIAIGMGVSIFVVIVVFTRYRYFTSTSTDTRDNAVHNIENIDNDDSSSSGAFVEVSRFQIQEGRQEQM